MSAGFAQVMTGVALLIVMVWVAWFAALKLLLPAWLAAMVQVPAFNGVTALPLIVQTSVDRELKVTVLPEAPPVALTLPVTPP